MNQIVLTEVDQLRHIVHGHKFLLVKGNAYDKMKDIYNIDTMPHVEFTDFTPNPLYEQVVMGVEIFNSESCDMIVAIGGGSAIDVAKCIKLFCRMNDKINYLKQPMIDSRIPIIAVPTTAGTGSESTRHAVIYFNNEKQSISHNSILPDYAILISSSLKNLPLYQKKCTMLDALCQAIESWWSVNSTDESIAYSKKAIELIVNNWEDYIYNNSDNSAPEIMKAANYSGRAINITATTAAHAMSYKLTSLFNLPHGHAVAICIPEVWKYMIEHTDKCIDSRGADYFKTVLSDINEMISLNDFMIMLEKMNITRPDVDDKEECITLLANSVNTTRLKNNPVVLSVDIIKSMYRRIV